MSLPFPVLQVISTTVQLLAPPLTIPLIETLVRKLERRPNRAPTVCPWVRAVLVHHTAYLVSVPSLHSKLAGLHQLATRRVAILPRLMGLAGRLDLVLSQISKHVGSRAAVQDRQPTDVYVDEDEGDEGGGRDDDSAMQVEPLVNGFGGEESGDDQDDQDEDEEEGEEGEGAGEDDEEDEDEEDDEED